MIRAVLRHPHNPGTLKNMSHSLSPAFAPSFETSVISSLRELTSEIAHIREDVTDLKQAGEKRDELMHNLAREVQKRDHARQNDFIGVDLQTKALAVAVVAIQVRIQTLEDKSEIKLRDLEKTAGHRINALEQKSSVQKGVYIAGMGFAGLVAFVCELLYHALDLGKFLFRK